MGLGLSLRLYLRSGGRGLARLCEALGAAGGCVGTTFFHALRACVVAAVTGSGDGWLVAG